MDRSQKLAVLVPVFNGGDNVVASLVSCMNSGLPTDEYELIVVDNCSTDNAMSRLPCLGAEVQIHLFRNHTNIGRIANWNRALDIALELGFQYVTFLFAGDAWISGPALKGALEHLRQTKARAALAPFVVADAAGKPKYQSRRFYGSGPATICDSSEFVGAMMQSGMFPLGPLQANIFRVDEANRPWFDETQPTRTDVQATLEFIGASDCQVVITDTAFLAWREHPGRFHASVGPTRTIEDYMATFQDACAVTALPLNRERAKANVVLNSCRLISRDASVKDWARLLRVVARCSHQIPCRLRPSHLLYALWQRFVLGKHPLQFGKSVSSSPRTGLFEQELLRNCAGAPFNQAARLQFQKLARRSLDWNYILKTAEEHGMLPLLRLRIDSFCEDQVPIAAKQELSRACRANAARNLALTGELLSILRLLSAEGIEAVPFKGPALAEQLFGSVAMRQFCDLDILVRPEFAMRAKELLMEHGYLTEFQLNSSREAEYFRAEHAFQLRRPANDSIVELHWSFGSKDQAFPLEAAGVWSRLITRTLQSRPVRALSPEDLFLYLCMHGAKHKWERLEWISSLAQLAAQDAGLNWQSLVEKAAAVGALRGLNVGLLLALRVCGLPLPLAIADRVNSDRAAAGLADRVCVSLFAERASHSAQEFHRQSFYLRSRERLIDRARIVWFSCARIPHPLARDWEMFHLPSRMSFLYYFLRPLRLFRDHGRRILQG